MNYHERKYDNLESELETMRISGASKEIGRPVFSPKSFQVSDDPRKDSYRILNHIVPV